MNLMRWTNVGRKKIVWGYVGIFLPWFGEFLKKRLGTLATGAVAAVAERSRGVVVVVDTALQK